jgi:hypothetical protein
MKTVIKTLLLTSIIILGSCSQKKIDSLELKNKQLEQRIDTLKISVDLLFRVVSKLDRNTPEYKHWVDSLRKAEEAKKAANLETLKSLEQTKDKK